LELGDILDLMVRRNASTAHLTVGIPVIFKIDGYLVPIAELNDGPQGKPVSLVADVIASVVDHLPNQDVVNANLLSKRWASARIAWKDFNVQAMAFYDNGNLGLTLKLIPASIPTLDALGLPRIIEKATYTRRGLIVVAGHVDGGKTTSGYAMVDHINLNRSERITICEDVMSYEMPSKMSVVTQQSIGVDIPSYEEAIDIARRTDVDVLMVDDLPTAVSVSKALQLAEQGRLVIALLPGATVEAALEVLIDRTCSPRDVVCRQLSRVLQAVIAQRLIWRSEPGPAELGGASVGKRGRLAVHEILVMNEAARKCVMNGQMDLREVMETNMMVGMQTMDQSILAAYQRGDIGYDTAANQMRDPSSLKD